MRPNGFSADRQSPTDLSLAVPCGDKLEDLALPLRESHLPALRVRSEEGIDVPRATRRCANCAQQIFYGCLLQQHCACSGAKRLGSQLGRSVAGVDDDASIGRGREDVFDQVDAASARHAVIENGHVGLRRPGSLDGIAAVHMRRYDLVVVFLEEVRNGCE